MYYTSPAYFSVYENQTITEKDVNTIGIKTDGIHFEGRYGKWHMVDILTCHTQEGDRDTMAIFGLFEHDYWGDATDYVLAWFDWFSNDCNWKEIGGTYDDIQTSLIDWDIIEYYTETR